MIRHIRRNGVAYVALFAAVATGGAYAADKLVGSDDIKGNAVRSKHIKKNAVKASDIADGAVGRAEVLDGSIGSNEIGEGAVGGAEVADGSLSEADLAPGALGIKSETDPKVHFAVVDAAGNLIAGKDASAAVISNMGENTYRVEFGTLDVSGCSYTATPAGSASSDTPAVQPSATASRVLVDMDTASGFHLQVICP